MGGLMYQLFTSSSLVSLGVYHLISTTYNFMKTPQSFSAKPYHPFHRLNRFKHLPLYLLIIFLLIAFAHQTFVSFLSDPLVKGSTPVHRFSSLQSAAVIFVFLLVSVSFLLPLPFPSDLMFAFSSAAFFLHYSAATSSAALQTSDLQAHCDSLSARISSLCSLLCLVLAFNPKLYVADAGLGGAVCLHGLWELQTGLSLYVDAFIPEGCHRLLDVVSGVEGSTKCDLQESSLRAVAVLDLMFVVQVMFVITVVLVTYAVAAKAIGIRRLGSYEALPTNSTDANHIQMKALTGTQA